MKLSIAWAKPFSENEETSVREEEKKKDEGRNLRNWAGKSTKKESLEGKKRSKKA